IRRDEAHAGCDLAHSGKEEAVGSRRLADESSLFESFTDEGVAHDRERAKGHSVISRKHDGGGGAMLRFDRPSRVHDAEDHVPERGGERLATAEMRDAV